LAGGLRCPFSSGRSQRAGPASIPVVIPHVSKALGLADPPCIADALSILPFGWARSPAPALNRVQLAPSPDGPRYRSLVITASPARRRYSPVRYANMVGLAPGFRWGLIHVQWIRACLRLAMPASTRSTRENRPPAVLQTRAVGPVVSRLGDDDPMFTGTSRRHRHVCPIARACAKPWRVFSGARQMRRDELSPPDPSRGVASSLPSAHPRPQKPWSARCGDTEALRFSRRS